MARWAKRFLRKHEDLNSVPRSHVKIQAWVLRTYNPITGEAGRSRSISGASQSRLISGPKLIKDLVSKTQGTTPKVDFWSPHTCACMFTCRHTHPSMNMHIHVTRIKIK